MIIANKEVQNYNYNFTATKVKPEIITKVVYKNIIDNYSIADKDKIAKIQGFTP